MAQASRVFISYSHDSDEHCQHVLAFAARLRSEGIDAFIDKFIVDPPGGWQYWMEKQIENADFIILICTKTYLQRVEKPYDTKGGAGVFWEASLVRSYLYDSKGADIRFIPTFFDAAGTEYIPRIVRSATHYQIDSPSGYEALYRRLTYQPAVSIPKLGDVIVLPRVESAVIDIEAMKPKENEFILKDPSGFIKLQALDHCNEQLLSSKTGSISTFIRFDNYLGLAEFRSRAFRANQGPLSQPAPPRAADLSFTPRSSLSSPQKR
jgi:hypothetical protein